MLFTEIDIGMLLDVVGMGVTYCILVTLETSQLPMSWLNDEAPWNMNLYITHIHTPIHAHIQRQRQIHIPIHTTYKRRDSTCKQVSISVRRQRQRLLPGERPIPMSGSASGVAGGLEAGLRVTRHKRTQPLRYQHWDSYEPVLIFAATGSSADGASRNAIHRDRHRNAA